MKKLNKFLFAFLMLQHFIVDDDGAGSGFDDDIEVDDIDIDDDIDDKDTSSKDKDDNNTGDKNSTIKSLQEKLSALEESVTARDNADKVASTINALKTKHDGFDDSKVKDYLVELNKTDPERANDLNNPIGWENVWLTQFKQKEVDNDNPNFGRNIEPVDRSEEVEERANRGDILSIEDEISYYGNNL